MSEPVVLITGASSGIGLALAEEYAARGARVALLARRAERLEEAAKRLGGAAIRCDVCVDGDVERAATEVEQRFGRIDVAIANAGIGVGGAIDKLTLDDYRRQFETNVFGVLRTVKAVLEPLRRTRGRLGIVGSVNGFLPAAGWSPYVASKFAVRGLAESLALELLPQGVSVTHIAPGFVESEMRLIDKRTGTLKDGARDPVPHWLVMPGRVAAKHIADAIEARQVEVVITNHGKLAAWATRMAPGLVRGVLGLAGKRMKPGEISLR
jgi:NAD(P)-dependent dehydrogenase (short-subunit alcohol dehydrogenase family)